MVLCPFIKYADQKFGAHTTIGYYGTYAEALVDLNHIATDLLGQAVRIHMRWDDIEAGATKPETKDWGIWDSVIAGCTSTGLTPVIFICGSPDWANGWTGYPYHIPGTGDDATFQTFCTNYATFCGEAAARYPTVKHWQIWNEENENGFWKEQDPSATLYKRMYNAARTAIKAQTADAIVSIGGLAGLNASGGIMGKTFLESLYTASCFPDAVSVHPYSMGESAIYPDEVSGPSEDILYENNFHDIAVIRALMATYSQAAKPIWATEFGCAGKAVPNWPTTWSTTLARQATYLTDMFTQLRDNYRYVTIATWFLLSDYATSFPGWGLYDESYNIRASGTAFHDFMAGL